ncbi:MAG: TIGR02757 family protein [Spirochaetales bacterium]|nr:TIGR02757 family protein [Spirochaetales bacterium]
MLTATGTQSLNRTLMKGATEDTGLLLESIYAKYHRPGYIHPDPLEFLGHYSDPLDIEIAALIASSFAIGRVNNILKVVESILKILKSPRKVILSLTSGDLDSVFSNFKYRFYTKNSLIGFLSGIRSTILEYGSLYNCFAAGVERASGDSVESLIFFVNALTGNDESRYRVLPDPGKGSACKRLNLFLRWMIRSDDIDPGIWDDIPKDILIIPLDTHIMQISRILGFTERKSADMKTAVEITNSLKQYDPLDPVRFDFSLTRLGIHPDLSYNELYSRET